MHQLLLLLYINHQQVPIQRYVHWVNDWINSCGSWGFELDFLFFYHLFDRDVCMPCIFAQVYIYFNQNLVLWLLYFIRKDTDNRFWRFFKLKKILPKHVYVTLPFGKLFNFTQRTNEEINLGPKQTWRKQSIGRNIFWNIFNCYFGRRI